MTLLNQFAVLLRPGRVPLKQWKLEEAQRLGISMTSMERRMSEFGRLYPELTLVRENARVIWVVRN